MDSKKKGVGGEESREGKRYFIDCSEAGQGCSMKVSGSYDEVLAAGMEHSRTAHGMSGDDKKLRQDLEGMIKEDRSSMERSDEDRPEGDDFPGSFQGRGQGQSGTSPGLPS